jgi:hypothetical protein
MTIKGRKLTRVGKARRAREAVPPGAKLVRGRRKNKTLSKAKSAVPARSSKKNRGKVRSPVVAFKVGRGESRRATAAAAYVERHISGLSDGPIQALPQSGWHFGDGVTSAYFNFVRRWFQLGHPFWSPPVPIQRR